MIYRILIIEDDPRICDELKKLLENNHYIVEFITTFEDVLSQIKSYLPHLILLDINLPIKDGFVLCSDIHNYAGTATAFRCGKL